MDYLSAIVTLAAGFISGIGGARFQALFLERDRKIDKVYACVTSFAIDISARQPIELTESEILTLNSLTTKIFPEAVNIQLERASEIGAYTTNINPIALMSAISKTSNLIPIAIDRIHEIFDLIENYPRERKTYSKKLGESLRNLVENNGDSHKLTQGRLATFIRKLDDEAFKKAFAFNFNKYYNNEENDNNEEIPVEILNKMIAFGYACDKEQIESEDKNKEKYKQIKKNVEKFKQDSFECERFKIDVYVLNKGTVPVVISKYAALKLNSTTERIIYLSSDLDGNIVVSPGEAKNIQLYTKKRGEHKEAHHYLLTQYAIGVKSRVVLYNIHMNKPIETDVVTFFAMENEEKFVCQALKISS
jgi:hypothetical protein